MDALRDFQPLTKECEKSLRFLIDHFTQHLREFLGMPTEHWDITVIHSYLQPKLARHVQDGKNIKTL